MNELVRNKIALKKFEEELTPNRALELIQSSIGKKVFELKDEDLSDHSGQFVLDILKFEDYLKERYPQFFDRTFISLEGVVIHLYGEKMSICIKKLL